MIDPGNELLAPGKSSRSLPQARRIVGPGDENGEIFMSRSRGHTSTNQTFTPSKHFQVRLQRASSARFKSCFPLSFINVGGFSRK